jgi:energy-coupling factor transporter ATP-binding protein EcfA2
MSYAKKIVSNVKSPNGDPYSVELGKHTLLIGNNESGKSAIAESLQLARTGSAFGLLYRDKPVKDGKLLSALIPQNEPSCSVTVELESGEHCSWALERGKRASRVGPNGANLSVAELHAIMAGSPETKARFFWRKLCEPMSAPDLLALLPEGVRETLLLVCPLDRPVDLADVLERIGKLQREQSSVVKAGQIALESLGTVNRVSDDELSGLWDAFNRAMLRDVMKVIYLDYKADPRLQASHVLSYLTEKMGGQDTIRRIRDTGEIGNELAEALLHKRMTRIAVHAKNGELRASKLRDSLKELKDAVLQVMHNGLDVVAESFCKTVGKFLPKGESLYFQASGGGMTLGLTRYDELHTALSGSTEARLLAAVSCALADESSVIVVDDRMWDALTLGKTMEVLEKAPCQVVVMSTIKPRGRKRSAWKYIEVSRTPGKPLEVDDGRKRENTEGSGEETEG